MTNVPKYHHRLRAEVLCAELLQNGLSPDALTLHRAGSFRKRFSRDIESLRIMSNDKLPGNTSSGSLAPGSITSGSLSSGNVASGSIQSIQLTLNRDSLYDLLPEGLFHQPVARSSRVGIRETISDFRRQKEEEKNARLFFQPLEHELMRLGVAIEQAEREYLTDITGSSLRSDSSAGSPVWELPSGLPPESLASLTRILPWAHLIKGDLDATRTVLGLLLKKDVKADERVTGSRHSAGQSTSLKESLLGETTVLGSLFQEPSVCWSFSITGLSGAEIVSFLPGRPYAQLLETFSELFIPVEMDTAFEYKQTPDHRPVKEYLGYAFSL